MFFAIPIDPRQKSARIRRIEQDLVSDDWDVSRDGEANRYTLGALYLSLGDVQGALDSYVRLRKLNPDDSGAPCDHLCWTLALHRSGRRQAAARKLVHTMLRNVYLVPALLGETPKRLNLWHPSNEAEPAYATSGAVVLKAVCRPSDLAWIHRTSKSETVQAILKRYIELWTELSGTQSIAARTAIVEKMSALRHG